MDKIVVASGANIIGRRGENKATRLLFPVEPWYDLYGAGGRFFLVAQRQGDATPYPVAVTTDDTYVYWTISAADTAIEGNGQCELYYFLSDTIAKSHIYTTLTFESMDDPGEPPEPQEAWLEQVAEYANAAAASAAEAEGYTSHPPIIGDNGNWWTWNGEEYEDSGDPSHGGAAEIVSITAVGTTLSPGSDATASVTVGGTSTERELAFSFGIPKGADGVGIASVEKTGTSGLVDTYTITFDNGDTETFTVTNGKDGEDAPQPYTHNQQQAAATWSITHNMGCYPSVTVADSAGSVVYGDVEYIDENSLAVSFVAPFSGVAYLN